MTPQPCANLNQVSTLFIKWWQLHIPCSRDLKSVSYTPNSSGLARSYRQGNQLQLQECIDDNHYIFLSFYSVLLVSKHNRGVPIDSFGLLLCSKVVKAWNQNKTPLLHNSNSSQSENMEGNAIDLNPYLKASVNYHSADEPVR